VLPLRKITDFHLLADRPSGADKIDEGLVFVENFDASNISADRHVETWPRKAGESSVISTTRAPAQASSLSRATGVGVEIQRRA